MKTKNQAPAWAEILEDYIARTKVTTWTKIAAKLNRTEGAIRHWRNGTREPNLSDFIRLCSVAQVDPIELMAASVGDEFKRQLVFFYNRIKAQDRRDTLIGTANRLYSEENPGASPANPFGGLAPTPLKPMPGTPKRKRIRPGL